MDKHPFMNLILIQVFQMLQGMQPSPLLELRLLL